MSDQLGFWNIGVGGSDNRPTADAIRASIARELRYLLTISHDASKPFHVGHAGVAHSIGVCLIEDYNMARGKGKSEAGAAGNALPRFVDVKLTAEDRKAFLSWKDRGSDVVPVLQGLADTGYRVGVSWSGEQQAYTVSLTCRDAESVNSGLCMTSFAKTLETAIWLAVYKHDVVTEGSWVDGTFGGDEGFG